MRIILLGIATSLLIGCGGGNACEDLKKKVCEGLDASKCGSWFDGMMKEGKKEAGGDMNAGCKAVIDDKGVVDGWKEMAKDAVGGAGKKDGKPAEDKKDEAKDDKKDEKKDEKKEGGW